MTSTRNWKLSFIGLLLTLCMLACNLPGATPEPTPTPTGTITFGSTPGSSTQTAATQAAAITPARSPTVNPDLIPYVIASDHSVVIYEVGETLLDEGNRYHTATGRTSSVSGTVYVDLDNPQNSNIGPLSINISTFQSDSEQRDASLRKYWLESEQYPLATFIPTALTGLPSSYQEGREVSFTVTGDLTVHGVTRQITFDVTVNVNDEQLSGQAIGYLLMPDFDIVPPSIAGVLQAEELVTIKFEFVAISEKG
ncbi:MAG: YceI family protein [Anaerolineales bacterium]|nr:YceI family protein [Anaerolineales bacterium]